MSISAPIIYNTIKVDTSDEVINLPRVSHDYLTVYEYLGRSDFYGAAFAFNTDDVVFQLFADGNLVCEDNIKKLKEFIHVHHENTSTVPNLFVWDSHVKVLNVNPHYPIQVKESIIFKAKCNKNDNKKKTKGYRVTLTKENAV